VRRIACLVILLAGCIHVDKVVLVEVNSGAQGGAKAGQGGLEVVKPLPATRPASQPAEEPWSGFEFGKEK
jgi:hypothetical protein